MRHKVSKGVLLTAGFSLLLTCVFYLAHDGILHNSRIIGWQAYTAIDLRTSSPSASKPGSSVTDAVNSTSSPSAADGQQYDDIFPLDLYAPTLPNPAPITEITVKSCLPLTKCQPITTPAEDALLGKWVQVDRSLSPVGQLGASAGGMLTTLFGTIEQRYIFYRRSRRRDVQNVVEVRLVEEGQTPPKGGDGWHRIKQGLRSKVVRMMSGEKSMHLYYRTVSPEQRDQEKLGFWKRADSIEAITELDLTYGDNPPWPGFVAAGIVSGSHPSMASARVTLTYRRTPSRKPPTTPLRFRPDGTFKVLQLADLHFSVSPEPCRDYDVHDPRWAARGCLSKNDTFALIDNWLDTERPDLVVLTGDQLNGQSTSWDVRSVLSLYTAPLIARKIPYAVILGNHDSEAGSLTREEQMQLVANMPFSYSSVGPSRVTGSGNYELRLRSPTDGGHVATLWFMDTGSRAEKDPWRPWSKPGYGYVHKDQIKWFEEKYAGTKETLLPYRPDGGKDLAAQPWRRAEGGVWDAGADGARVLGRPPSVVFMHIPVPEAFSPVDKSDRPNVVNPTKGEGLVVGDRQETATFAGAQAHPSIFDLFTTLNSHKSVSETSNAAAGGVRLLVHGHMHLNSDCRRVDGIWICFGGGSSLAGYGKESVQRRARVIVLEDWASRIRTYHRISSVSADEASKRFDEFVLN